VKREHGSANTETLETYIAGATGMLKQTNEWGYYHWKAEILWFFTVSGS
jgi:hypothetical protein